MLSMARCCWAKAAGTPGSSAQHLEPGQKQGGALQEQMGVAVGSASSQELCGATKDGVRGELLDPFCSEELELGPANSHPGATRSHQEPAASSCCLPARGGRVEGAHGVVVVAQAAKFKPGKSSQPAESSGTRAGPEGYRATRARCQELGSSGKHQGH